MVIIGENIHILSKSVSEAIKNRDKKPLQELALKQAEAGADYIDLNIGPARKEPEVMGWLVETIQEAVDKPLSLDTMNPIAMEEGLKVCKVKALINSASGKRESIENMLPLATKYDADVVISVLTDEGVPKGVDDRVASIMETVSVANDMGIPNDRIWVDPILLPVAVEQDEVVACLEFASILQDVVPGVKSTIGLSNLSNSAPKELRPILNRTYLVMLSKYGFYSAIADALDEELMKLAKGELPEIVELIYKVMDGEEIDPSSLSKKELEYYKTVKVLKGDSLYSHSWLEL